MKKILVTGGTGMVGVALPSATKDYKLIKVGSSFDLRSEEQTHHLFKLYNPDAVIHLAARVGGVKANTDYIADFFHDNIMINTNVLKLSKEYKVSKVVSLLSTCVYPNEISFPLLEKDINNGSPHDSNFGYAYAKRMIDVYSRALRQQHGCNFITAIPNNLFGENDNFHLNDSHVIPAIIRKMHEASIKNDDVVLWGDGTPLREFTYSKDLADILLFLLENYDEPSPINIGNTAEISIKYVAEKIAEIIKFKGSVIWDDSKPMGQFRKPSDNSKLLNLGWSESDYTDFDQALVNTCEWFKVNYPNVRGV